MSIILLKQYPSYLQGQAKGQGHRCFHHADFLRAHQGTAPAIYHAELCQPPLLQHPLQDGSIIHMAMSPGAKLQQSERAMLQQGYYGCVAFRAFQSLAASQTKHLQSSQGS